MASSKTMQGWRDLVKQSYSSLLCGRFLWAPPSLSFATQSLLTVVPTVQSIYFWDIFSWPNCFFSKVSAFIWFGLQKPSLNYNSKVNSFDWVEVVNIRGFSCVKSAVVSQVTDVNPPPPPPIGAGLLLAFHWGRRLLLGDIVAWIRLEGEIWHRGEAVSYHPVPPQMAGQQAHQFTLVCQRPVVQSFVCAYKRDQRELSEVSTVSPVVSLGPLNRLALFFD